MVIWLRHECSKSDKRFENFQNEGKWLINAGEDPIMGNATLDTGRSLKQTLTWC